MRGGTQHHGFTLLELVLVLVILSTVMAMTAPSLHGWSRGSYLRDTADQFVALTRLARSQAVASAKVHRLQIEETGQYQLLVQQGQEFVPSESSDFGRVFLLPEGYRIELKTTVQGHDNNYLEFHPSGRTLPALVRIVSDQEEIVDIECASPAEAFEVVNTGAMP